VQAPRADGDARDQNGERIQAVYQAPGDERVDDREHDGDDEVDQREHPELGAVSAPAEVRILLLQYVQIPVHFCTPLF
jgi:hypothetical protein